MRMKRGSGRAAAERSEPGSRRKRTRKSRGGGGSDSRLRLWAKRIALWGGGLAVLGAVFLAVAVSFAVQTMPSYYQLKATQNDQTILCARATALRLWNWAPVSATGWTTTRFRKS